MDKADVDHRFAFHPASTREKQDDHTSIRAAHRHLAHEILDGTPTCREQSLAITKLEESMMWANAAIARQTPGRGPGQATAPQGQGGST